MLDRKVHCLGHLRLHALVSAIRSSNVVKETERARKCWCVHVRVRHCGRTLARFFEATANATWVPLTEAEMAAASLLKEERSMFFSTKYGVTAYMDVTIEPAVGMNEVVE